MKFRSLAGLGVVYCVLVLARDAHAYIDPGTGSYIIQIAIGVFLGAAFAFKNFIARIFSFFGGKRKDDTGEKK